MTTAFPSRPVTLLTATIALLVLLIAGQGMYLYRLEREEARVRLQMERTQALYESARELLELEFQIPPDLVDWEMRHLQRVRPDVRAVLEEGP